MRCCSAGRVGFIQGAVREPQSYFHERFFRAPVLQHTEYYYARQEKPGHVGVIQIILRYEIPEWRFCH